MKILIASKEGSQNIKGRSCNVFEIMNNYLTTLPSATHNENTCIMKQKHQFKVCTPFVLLIAFGSAEVGDTVKRMEGA